MGLSYEDMKSRITGELKRLFRPEFLNRVDEVIVFHKLTREEIRLIVDLLVVRTGKQLAEKGLSIELTDAAGELLVEKGYDPTLGARPLRRAIQRYIEDKLADILLERQLEPGTVIQRRPARRRHACSRQRRRDRARRSTTSRCSASTSPSSGRRPTRRPRRPATAQSSLAEVPGES